MSTTRTLINEFKSDIKDLRPLRSSGLNTMIYTGKWEGKPVIVKEVFYGGEIDSLERCENEVSIMQTLKELNAENIVDFLGYDFNHFTFSLAMEYIPQGDLYDYIASHETPLAWSLRYDIIKGTINGLLYLHENNIIHRDIKTENILLDENLKPKICDFGTAIQTTELPLTDYWIGTGGWRAPEIIDKIPYNEKVDIYSFSLLMWAVAAWSAMPFPSLTELQINNLTSDKRETIPATCPAPLAHLINLGFAQDPNMRPTANKLQSELNMIKEEDASENFSKLTL